MSSQSDSSPSPSPKKASNFRRRGQNLKGPFRPGNAFNKSGDDHHDGKRKGGTRSWERFTNRTIHSVHRLISQKCPILLNHQCNIFLFISLVFWLVIALSPGTGNGHSIRKKNHHTVRVVPRGRTDLMSPNNPPANSNNNNDNHEPGIFESAVHGLSSILSQRKPKRKKNREADAPGCVRPDWHSFSFQNCNEIHGIDLRETILRGNKNKGGADGGGDNNPLGLGFVAAGLWRSVYIVAARDAHEVSVLKVMKGEHSVDARNIDRHRRDALVMERLTGSPNVVEIFGFCGNTVLTEFAPKPLDDLIYAKTLDGQTHDGATRTTPRGRLELAIGTFKGLAAIHEVEGGPIVHADIQARQFLISNSGEIKINDFNRCRIMARNNVTGESCKFVIPTSPGKARSPEEYKESKLDEKLDVYSTANVLYGILTGQKAWYQHSSSETKKFVKQGAIPTIPDQYRRPGTIDFVLTNLTERAYENDPSKRISAREIVVELERARDQLMT